MRAVDLLVKKRDGLSLTKDELHFLFQGYIQGTIPDYQMSAWAMAVLFQGMTFEECTHLTLEMAHSGDMIDLSAIPGIKVDKHSTGGVGDKTSLVLLPLVAACGVPVAKMSGRGLGHTGGTLDKLESIPGLTTSLSRQKFLAQVKKMNIAIIGQTGDLVPADKKLYSLRDVTATVESIPLIASSIVSKKLAAGADAIVLDVKYGDGAFMNTFDKAHELAKTMVEIGQRAGRKFIAILSNMAQPLGNAIGNRLEVSEAIATLQMEGPQDLTELCITLGSYMVWLGGKAATLQEGRERITQALTSGKGYDKFKELIKAQGGDVAYIEQPENLGKAPVIHQVKAIETGWLQQINCRSLGLIAMQMGAGRSKIDDIIRPDVGLKVYAKVGDYVSKGTVLGEIHSDSESITNSVIPSFIESFHWVSSPVSSEKLIEAVVE